jgi:predicted nuclease of predicted toxin-antitoxin system
MHAASVEEVFGHAARDDRVVVSADTDFGTLLATRKQTAPSVILFRHSSNTDRPTRPRRWKPTWPQVASALEAGRIVVIQPDRTRIRALPLIP